MAVAAPAGACAGAFSGKWQATSCPGASCSSGGSWVLQMSCAFQHRVWNRQAGGGLIGLGTSPWSRIRSRWVRREVSGTGTADISAVV